MIRAISGPVSGPDRTQPHDGGLGTADGLPGGCACTTVCQGMRVMPCVQSTVSPARGASYGLATHRHFRGMYRLCMQA